MHSASLEWLRDELRKGGDWDQTVVVTHHAPSWQILEAANVLPRPISKLNDPRLWAVSQAKRDTDHYGPQLYRLAGYATPLDHFLLTYQDSIDLWCHGHIHEATDVPIHGVRVVSNPRGYSMNAYRSTWKKVADDIGIEHVPEGWREHLDDINCGDGHCNERLVIDPENGTWPLVLTEVSKGIEELEKLLEEIFEFRGRRKQPDPLLKAAVIEAIRSRIRKFIFIAMKLFDMAQGNLTKRSSFRDPLAKFGINSISQRMPSDDILAESETIERLLSISDAKKTISSLKRLTLVRNRAIKAKNRVTKRALAKLKVLGLDAFVDFDNCRLLSDEITFWVPLNTPLWDQAQEAIREISRETGYSLHLREFIEDNSAET